MKLKKIASLMLAGIMAVSMLAACGEGKDNGGNAGSSSSETPVAGYSADILDATNASTKSLMNAKDNSTLNAAVKAAGAEANNSSDLVFLSTLNTNYHQLNQNATDTDVQRIRNAFIGNLNSDTDYVTSNAGKASVITDNGKYATLFAFDRKMTDAQIAGVVGSYIDDIMMGAVQNDGATKINYTLSAANTFIGTNAKGVVLVGIQIERTTTNA